MMREMTDKDFVGMTDEEISEAMTDGEYFSDMTDEVNTEMSGVDYLGRIIEARIRRAKTGDTAAAKELMKDFCGGIKMYTGKDGKTLRTPSGMGIQIDDRILRYFGECFGHILNGDELESAMNLKRYDSRPPDPTLKERNIEIAFEADKRVNAKVTRRSPKKPKGVIYTEIGLEQKESLGFESVKKIVGEYKPLVNNVNAVDLPSILEELDAEWIARRKGK